MLDPINDHDERVLRIALAIIARPGDADVADCVDHRGLAKTLRLLADHREELAQTSRRDRWTRQHLHTSPDKLLSAAAELTEHSVIPGDPWWPDQQITALDRLGVTPPWCLWIKTRPPIDPTRIWGRAIAVLGTGDHTGYGYENTRRIVHDLGHQRHPVAALTGPGPDHLRYGGLSAVAAYALAADDTATGLVIGTDPVDTPSILNRAGEPAVYLTTTPPGVTDTGRDLLDYHAQLHAALARASLILETGTEPHILTHIEAARALHQPLFALPGPADAIPSRYCHHLIRRGHARLVTSADDLIEDLYYADH